MGCSFAWQRVRRDYCFHVASKRSRCCTRLQEERRGANSRCLLMRDNVRFVMNCLPGRR